MFPAPGNPPKGKTLGKRFLQDSNLFPQTSSAALATELSFLSK